MEGEREKTDRYIYIYIYRERREREKREQKANKRSVACQRVRELDWA